MLRALSLVEDLSGEPIFEPKVFDVLEVAGVVRHKGGAVCACDGCGKMSVSRW
jgi:hypothetical protein